MNIKDYRTEPEDGLFEKIQHRLAVRRALRIGGVSIAVLVAVGVAAIALWPKGSADEVAMVVPQATVPDVYQNEEDRGQMPVVGERSADVNKAEEIVAQDVKQNANQTVANAPADELADLAQMLPQGLPAVMPLNEAAAEEQTSRIQTTPVSASLAKTGDTTSPQATVPTSPKDKSGVQMPHYDNVIWAPNVIIPSGEVEENRTFSIKATSEIADFKLHIYNRNGRRIYMTSDPQFSWDGTMNGANAPQGAYVWVATFRDSDGVARQEKGTVTVIR